MDAIDSNFAHFFMTVFPEDYPSRMPPQPVD